MKIIEIGFTQKRLEDIPFTHEGRQIYRDKKERYLYLFVTRQAKAFYYIRKKDGRTIQYKIDTFPTITVFQAHQRCEELSAALAAGVDIVTERRKLKAGVTFGNLFEIYLDQHLKTHARTWEEDERRFNVYFPDWKNKKMDSIVRTDVIGLHNRLCKNRGATTANRVIQLIRRVFNYHLKNNSISIPNPAANIVLFPEESRSRFLGPEEVKRFLTALSSEPDQCWRDFFALALFTGARRSNLQSMEWDEIHFERSVWIIPQSKFKTGDECSIPLVDAAIEILKIRKTVMREESRYVFPADSRTGHIIDPRKAWGALLKRAKIEDFHIHDLRRTLGSWQASGGASLQIIGKSLGHVSMDATQIYARLNLEPVRASMDHATGRMLELMKDIDEPKSAREKLLALLDNLKDSDISHLCNLIESGTYLQKNL